MWSSNKIISSKKTKMCYMGHRRWLPTNHRYRRQKIQFDGSIDMELAPETTDGTAILEMLEGKKFVFGKKGKGTNKDGKKCKKKKVEE